MQFRSEGIDFENAQYISEKDHHKIQKRSSVDCGDILFAMIGTIGNPVIVNVEREFSIKNVALFKFVGGQVHAPYFKHLLETPIIKRQLSSGARGGNQKFVALNVLRNMQIPLPPLPEQKRIAAILDKADAIRRKRKEAIRLTEEFLKSAFLEMFGDPVTNPKGWEVKPLSKCISDIKSGWSSKSEARHVISDEWGVLKVSAVTSGKYLPTEHKAVGYPKFHKTPIVPQVGDLLFSRANTRDLVAATCLVEKQIERLFLPDKLWKIETKTEVMKKEYLRYLLGYNRFRSLLTRKATGTSGSMLNVSQGKLLEMEAPIPPVEIQDVFRKIVWRNYALNERLETNIIATNKLFNSLVQRAFRGEL